MTLLIVQRIWERRRRRRERLGKD